ncbi:MAG: hypothetical protein E4H27_02305 [Anaerolineales bacterium]|nr:MAG: hypothetical protein E4H27_02305 [Anaerolineales bacterium]
MIVSFSAPPGDGKTGDFAIAKFSVSVTIHLRRGNSIGNCLPSGGWIDKYNPGGIVSRVTQLR